MKNRYLIIPDQSVTNIRYQIMTPQMRYHKKVIISMKEKLTKYLFILILENLSNNFSYTCIFGYTEFFDII